MKEKLNSAFMKKLLALVFPIAFQQFMLALVSASDGSKTLRHITA